MDILNALPGPHMTLDIMVYVKLLTQEGTDRLGDFDIPYITDKRALGTVER